MSSDQEALSESVRPIETITGEKEQEEAPEQEQGEQGEQGEQEPEGQEEEQEEGEDAKVRRRPKMPTMAEREKHEATHMPFRSWCRHCVRGRGRNSPHWKRQQADEDPEAKEAKVPRVSMDYHFMSQADEKAGKNHY